MNTIEFFNTFISPRCHKVEHTFEELQTFKDDAVLVKATTLYQIYQHNVFEVDGRLSMRDFYRIAAQYLYYDKYICTHGTEFYYYVVFNTENLTFQLTEELTLRRVEANAPDTLDDIEYVVHATTRRD